MDNLTENILKSFRMRTAFRDFNSNHDKRIHSINFSTNGMTLVSSSNNDLIEIFDCDRGRQVDTISVRKYGCYFVNFAQTSNDVLLISSERRDHVIRSLNIEKKSYLTYFEGHTDVVTSLCVNRHKNLFVSSSSDKTVRLWDVRSPRCEGMCTLKGDVIGAWSGDGQLIAAAIDSESIELFDIRSLENGPISRCKLNKLYNSKCIDMKFSKNSRNILLSTNGPNLLLIDTCYGKELQAYRSRKNVLGLPIRANFNTDSEYVFSGSSDGHLHIWNAMTGFSVAEVESQYLEAIMSVQCNPIYSILATASSFVALWTPHLNGVI